MPLPYRAATHRCFDGASLAQHDRRKKRVIPSEVEKSRGNERGVLFLILAFSAEYLNYNKGSGAKN